MTAVGLPLTELFFSRNDAWFNLRLCLWWTIPTWTLGTYAVYHHGLFGFAIFQAALQSTWLLAFLHARKLEGLHVFTPLREPLILSAGLVLGNLLLVRFLGISSFYQLALVLALEGLICGLFLVRMLLSWRLGPGPAAANSSH
jgi:O-antigen/teichoic acid export membrane protein